MALLRTTCLQYHAYPTSLKRARPTSRSINMLSRLRETMCDRVYDIEHIESGKLNISTEPSFVNYLNTSTWYSNKNSATIGESQAVSSDIDLLTYCSSSIYFTWIRSCFPIGSRSQTSSKSQSWPVNTSYQNYGSWSCQKTQTQPLLHVVQVQSDNLDRM